MRVAFFRGGGTGIIHGKSDLWQKENQPDFNRAGDSDFTKRCHGCFGKELL